jgi:hypothetical protein
MEDDITKTMTRLKLRTFVITSLLVSMTVAGGLTFSTSLLSGTNEAVSTDAKQDLASFGQNVSKTSESIENEGFEDAQDPTIDSDFFFIREMWSIITSVPKAAVNVTRMILAVPQIVGLNIPNYIVGTIASIITVGVAFAVVSAERGWDV